jgi:hypothetical protein
MKSCSYGIRAVELAFLVAICTSCGDDSVRPDGPPPEILSVSPSTGTVGTEIRIVGNDFRNGATVFVGAREATAVEVTSGVEVFAFVPEGIVEGETYDVRIRNSDGTKDEFPSAFTAVAPRLRFVNAATKPSGNPGSTVIIEGDAFGDLQGSGQVLFSDGLGGTVAAVVGAPDDWTNTFIVTTVPSSAESGPVFVTTATGTSESLDFTVTQNAVFSPSTIEWTETTALPEPLSGHLAIYVPIEDALGNTDRLLYVVGGTRADGTLTGQVHSAEIRPSGDLGTWAPRINLNEPRAFSAAVAATPFNSKVPGVGRIFVLGGIDANGEPSTAVFSLELDSEGNLSSLVGATPLPISLHSAGAVLFRSHIYLVGGASTNGSPVAAAYRAAVDTLGALGSWEELEAMPVPRAYHGLQTFGGYLYAVGGDQGAVDPHGGMNGANQSRIDQIHYVKINLRNGDFLGSWLANPAKLGKARSKHSALAAGGNLFVSAGLYAAANTGSSENTYAQINSDGTIASFGGATGSNTLQSAGAGNLYNHAAVSYVDGDGVARVMVLGGDNVNSPGARSAKVFYY